MSDRLAELLDEVRLLWHRMVQIGEALHQQEPVTLGMRAVLEFLLLHGPAPVPHIARSRYVTRQHIQALVNALLERRLVVVAPNPAHKRSRLVTLTREGEHTIRRMRQQEGRMLERTAKGVNAAALRRAAETLRRVRRGLGEGTQ
jgi:DNA-binding MarR family transcriptional regulator